LQVLYSHPNQPNKGDVMTVTTKEVIDALTKSRKYVADFLSHAPGSSTAREVLDDVDKVLFELSSPQLSVDELQADA
jgi:Fe2+ or Zn2+ uptake regulation protein